MSMTTLDTAIEREKTQILEERISYYNNLKLISLAKEKFLKTGKIDPCVRPEVAESWQRSVENVDPNIPKLKVLSEEEYKETLEKNKLLIKCGSYVMASIYKTISDRIYIIHISDKYGNILDVNDDYQKDRITRLSITPGACFHENKAGTNAISLSLTHNRDMAAHGAEHFLLYQHNTTCTTSIIRNSQNNIIGTITLTFNVDMYNNLLSGISAIAARMIEKEIVRHTFSNVLESIVNNSIESILVIDSNLNILVANSKFLDLIDIKESDIPDLNIQKILPELDFSKITSKAINLEIIETTLTYKNKQYQVSIHTKTAINDDSFDYIILFFQEINTLINLTRKYTGKYNYYTFNDIITNDPVMLKLIDNCKRIANLDIPILITGNSGTGKELFAQSIHSYSARVDKPFMAVNCAALPNNLIESELFGYEKGAFTGAQQTGKPGKFELADGGTIFLDEIGELPLDVQAKILRILDDYRVSRIGGVRVKSLNVRVIAATNRNLNEEVGKKNFRLDLFYRLNVLNINIPPLEDRLEDIKLLTEYFLNSLNEKNKTKKYLNSEALDILCSYKWPGNVREFQNNITKAYYLSFSDVITKESFSFPKIDMINFQKLDFKQFSFKSDEQIIIENALDKCYGQVGPASQLLNMPVSSLYRKITKYNIKRQKNQAKNPGKIIEMPNMPDFNNYPSRS
jgi:transcriptional regulator with PAS, ATPase and Fis domain